ncbi:MAG: hypothetical protein ACI4L2_07745 [Wujia sp.]
MNWILANLTAAVEFFNAWMGKLYEILMIDPISYQNGTIWAMVEKIYNALLGPGISILIISFYLGLIHDGGEFIKTRRIGSVAWTFILMCVSVSVLQGGKYILLLVFWAGRELFENVTGINGLNLLDLSWVEIPKIVEWATYGMDMEKGFLFWIVTLIFALVVMICGFTILMIVYGRLLNIYMHFALAPLPLACMAAKPTRSVFSAYIRSFIGVCIQGLVIVVICMIFSAFANGFDYHDTEIQLDDVSVLGFIQDFSDLSAEERQERWNELSSFYQDEETVETLQAKILWEYLSQMIFMYLMMAGMIKGADTWIHQKLNL